MAGETFVPSAGHVLAGKYVLARPAGFGGMAELWVATNRATSGEVCVKIFIPGGATPDAKHEQIERFRREARAGANLHHRAIVRVFDLLELDVQGDLSTTGRPDVYAIVMELLSGESLGDTVARRGPLSLDEALDVFLPLLSALAHAHSAGVVHRDIKPDNVFLAVEPDGHLSPKVLDFGVSKILGTSALTEDGVVVGTATFMSPEQARGSRTIDARSDVFSAAIVFVVMLTGSNPFGDEADLAATVDAILRRDVSLPGLPPKIRAVVERALAKDPKVRFADAGDMSLALRAAAGLQPSESAPTLPRAPLSSMISFAELPPSTPVPARPRSRLLLVIAGGVVLAALLAVALVRVVQRPETSAPAGSSSSMAATTPPVEAPASASFAPASRPMSSSTPPPAIPHPVIAAPKPSRRPGTEPRKARAPGF